MVLVRRGRFRRRATGADADIDATMAYIGVPGEEERFAHPAGGDDCTSISLTPALWQVMAGDVERLAAQSVYVDTRLDLTHRRLLATARTHRQHCDACSPLGHLDDPRCSTTSSPGELLGVDNPTHLNRTSG
ncbi:hypothetical protein ACFPH6_20390 [Streptomyces xiangluensis]|uniref:Uncharacterized protein n=1 Tax=Streptomyces xiangluensis TaxID=2665720 RepID=A0ABV8YNI6_9ACTN